MRGKEKCKALKEIRKQIAEANDIAYAVSECTHQGDCKGTCPKCESELRYLERELAIRKNLGKAVAVVGLSTGVCTSLTACSPTNILQNIISNEEVSGSMEAPSTQNELNGEIACPPPSETPATQEMLEGNIEGEYEIEGDIVIEPTEDPIGE